MAALMYLLTRLGISGIINHKRPQCSYKDNHYKYPKTLLKRFKHGVMILKDADGIAGYVDLDQAMG